METFTFILDMIRISISMMGLSLLSLALLLIGCLTYSLWTENVDNRKREQQYEEWLVLNEGKNFFCYNERRKIRPFVEANILPLLEIDIIVVFLENRQISTEGDTKMLSMALYKLQNYQKFPHLIKIRNGQLVDKSISNLIYDIKNKKLPREQLIQEIDLFFEC